MIEFTTTTYDDRIYSATPAHRHQIGKGCFRYVHDGVNDQAENWQERLYRDDRPIGLRKAKWRR